MKQLRAGQYLHYKGGIYHVLGLARHSDTEEIFVAYIPLGVKAGPRITVRPYQMFFEDVVVEGKKVPRFKFIGETVPEELAKNYHPFSKKG